MNTFAKRKIASTTTPLEKKNKIAQGSSALV